MPNVHNEVVLEEGRVTINWDRVGYNHGRGGGGGAFFEIDYYINLTNDGNLISHYLAAPTDI
jgi:hypothetical protein